MLLLHHILPKDPVVTIYNFSIIGCELCIPQIITLDYSANNGDPCYESICTEPGVQEQKCEKVLVIFKADTLIDPNTVVVKLLDAHVAQTAVLTASCFVKLTSSTLHFRLIHDVVVLKSF